MIVGIRVEAENIQNGMVGMQFFLFYHGLCKCKDKAKVPGLILSNLDSTSLL
jgi:hypothetical protein